MQSRSLNALLQHGIIVHAWLSHSLSLSSSRVILIERKKCSLLKLEKKVSLAKAPVKAYYLCVTFHAALSSVLFFYFSIDASIQHLALITVGFEFIIRERLLQLSPLRVSSGWDFSPSVFQAVAHYAVRMFAQITVPASACSWCLYTCVCVCVCVRECDQISGSGIFMSSVWIRNTPTTNLGCTFLRALRSSEKLQHQTSSYFVELRKANTFLPCIIQDQAKLVEHRLNQSLTNSVFSHVRLPSFSKWTTSRLSPNRCLLTGNCRYVFWTEPSQAVFEKLLTDVMWPAQALYLLRFG